jgi:hypothetical protein
MRLSALSRLGGWLSVLGFFGCSLGLEDPELDAQKKLAKTIPTTMAALVGRWKGDSTFAVDDTRASGLDDNTYTEIFADTTYSQRDTTRLVFPGGSDGVFYLGGDTLITFPSTASPDTFLVKIRFLGNYLELFDVTDQRYSFYHKVKPQDSATQIAMLKDSLWRKEGQRLDPGIFQQEPQVRNFSYLRFAGDSMFSDMRRNGVIRTDSGPLAKSGFKWTWKASAGTQEFIADLIHEDSLRMWPLTDGRPDSGYHLHVKTGRYHRNDVDMRPMTGHMRTDSIRYSDRFLENHYGQFYDWVLTEDHKVRMETNMAGMPMFESWALDSGFLSMDAPGYKGVRFRVDTAGAGVVKLLPDSGKAFGKAAIISLTKVDPERFRDKPLERFENASYLQLVIKGDTSDYFFRSTWIKDQFEIAGFAGDSILWASITVNKALETYQSSQPGFYFAFEGIDSALGRFKCKSVPEKDLVIRSTGGGDPLMAQGLLQGACKVLSAGRPFTDSTLILEGSFRLKRKTYGSFQSIAWFF